MERVQYISSEHATSVAEASDSNNIASDSSPNHSSPMRNDTIMMHARLKQSSSLPMRMADGGEMKLLKYQTFHRTKNIGNTRRCIDTSLRMRPYFIPERSRTKSENSIEPETYATMNYCDSNLHSAGTSTSTASTPVAVAVANNICIDSMNSNSNSMMDTCDAFPNSECTSGASSCSTLPITHNGFTTFNCSTVLPHIPIVLNSNQYFRPIKCASFTGHLKRSKSLESVRVETIESSQQSHEMEFVSTRFAAKFKIN